MIFEVKELGCLDKKLYSCITECIDSSRVVLTDKQIIHMQESHPDAYEEVLIELKETIKNPDYKIKDEKHINTGLVVRKICNKEATKEHSFVVLRICTDCQNGKMANSIISGWKISEKRLQSYLRNKHILYKKE